MSKNEQQMRPFASRDWRVTLACLGQRTLKSFVKWKPIRARNSSTNGSSTTRRRRSKCHGVATTTAIAHQGPAYSPTSRWLRSTMARSSASPLTRPAVKTNPASSTFWLQVSDKISDITIIVHTYTHTHTHTHTHKLCLCNSRKWKWSVCLLLLASSKLCHNILNIIYHMYTHIYATYVGDSSSCIIVAHGWIFIVDDTHQVHPSRSSTARYQTTQAMRSWSPASRVFMVDCRRISRSTSSRRATHQVGWSFTRFSPNPSSFCQVSRRTCATRLQSLPSTQKGRVTTSSSKYLHKKNRRDSWRSNQASRQVRLLFLTIFPSFISFFFFLLLLLLVFVYTFLFLFLYFYIDSLYWWNFWCNKSRGYLRSFLHGRARNIDAGCCLLATKKQTKPNTKLTFAASALHPYSQKIGIHTHWKQLLYM